MKIEAYLNGIFPRSDEALNAGSRLLKGRDSKENFDKLLEKETIELIELQQSLGLDYVTDGQLFWNDFLRPVAAALRLHAKNSNADENPVTRQIYTNTFYRKPIISGRFGDADEDLIDTRFIDLIGKGKRKIILPSPFALAYLSDGIHRNENGSIKDDAFADILHDASKALNNGARRLENHSISFVQFNEPCLAYAEESVSFWNDIVESLKTATRNLNAVTSLHLYNGDASRFLPDLEELPVDRIGIDAYSTNLRKFKGAEFRKFLEFGVINSKNSLIEEPEALAKYAEQAAKQINPDGLALVPNRPLELVPRQVAVKKVESLAEAAKLLRGEK
ncbi:hypothetical protein HYS31_05530 [Candidatus Woesearchaeota archaeon]|nr:hypothetical protein [Candidatus Woesearchaeota archaeon]